MARVLLQDQQRINTGRFTGIELADDDEQEEVIERCDYLLQRGGVNLGPLEAGQALLKFNGDTAFTLQ